MAGEGGPEAVSPCWGRRARAEKNCRGERLRSLPPARFPARAAPSAQQLERVTPAAAKESGDAPEHAQRLDRARRLDRAQVLGVPAESIEHGPHLRLCRLVVPADEHRGRPPVKLRVYHEWVSH